MRYPSFIAELGSEAHRPKLWLGVYSGYFLAVAFGVLILVGVTQGLVPLRWGFFGVLGLKVITNTLAAISLKTNRWVLELSGINVMADVVVMTGAIYLTGGQVSPLFAIYVIEITVIAMLSNLGTTVMIGTSAYALYCAMAVASWAGVVPYYPAPLGPTRPPDGHYMVTMIGFAGFLLGVITTYTAVILRLLRRKELALEQRTAELLDAGRNKSQFMANISHELRTPIQGICGLSDLVEGEIYGPVNERQREAHRTIKRSALSLLSMIDELLGYTRAEAGKLEVQLSEVDVGDLVTQAIAAVRFMADTKRIRLAHALPHGPLMRRSDRAKLTQILINLLVNGIKFTPEEGRVSVSVSQEPDGGLSLAIADTGIGIAEEEIDHIFEAFRQVDGTPERQFGGIGLGLALVKRLVDLLGGEINVRSALGQGSTFTVRLPQEVPSPPQVTG